MQLAVPVLAAAGGVAVLGEEPTVRLAVSSVLILGGVAVAVVTSAAVYVWSRSIGLAAVIGVAMVMSMVIGLMM